MKNSTKSFGLAFIVVCLLYNAVFWLIPFEKTAPTVISYVFTMVAIIMAAAISFTALGESGAKSKVYGFPIFRIAVMYAVAQIIIGAIFIIISHFVDIEAWIVILVSVLLFGLAMIGIVVADSTRATIESLESKTVAQTYKIKQLRNDIQSVVSKASDAEVKAMVKKLAEKLQYSDPVSSPALASIEGQIESEIKKLSMNINGDKEQALVTIKYVNSLLEDRNRQCKTLKK